MGFVCEEGRIRNAIQLLRSMAVSNFRSWTLPSACEVRRLCIPKNLGKPPLVAELEQVQPPHHVVVYINAVQPGFYSRARSGNAASRSHVSGKHETSLVSITSTSRAIS